MQLSQISVVKLAIVRVAWSNPLKSLKPAGIKSLDFLNPRLPEY